MAVVGLEDVIYGGYEDEEEIQLCVKVFSPAIDCPIEFPFNVSLSTIDGIAGKMRFPCYIVYTIPFLSTQLVLWTMFR